MQLNKSGDLSLSLFKIYNSKVYISGPFIYQSSGDIVEM